MPKLDQSRLSWASIAGLCFAPMLLAQTAAIEPMLVVSPSAEAVSLSVYRDPKGTSESIDPNWPSGYALITETRTVDLPAGEFVLRFEGVADGMFPESAIVSGLPEGVREKNRDARLLSPSGLVDAYLKRTVHISRTNKATGKISEMEARITAAPNGAVVLQTADGYEALHCTGLPERMLFASVPANLSAKPTLSVLATSTEAVRVNVTLSYMAEGFDWQANYLATVRGVKPGGAASIDLLAWLTLANGGNQSFANAQTMVMAGLPNRVARAAQTRPQGGALTLQCWPTGRTDQVPLRAGYIPLPPPPPAPMYSMSAIDEITVTGSRIRRMDRETVSPAMVAEQEDLGDLKLYRVPEPVNVNAHGQKQVALMLKPGAKFELYYAAEFGGEIDEQPLMLNFRAENIPKNDLGLPLPKGNAEIFQQTDFGPLWLGNSSVRDLAIGEKLELEVSEASDVRMLTTTLSVEKTRLGQLSKVRLTLSNAKSQAVQAEVKIPVAFERKPSAIKSIDGVPTWNSTIPANGKVSIEFEMADWL